MSDKQRAFRIRFPKGTPLWFARIIVATVCTALNAKDRMFGKWL